MTGRLLTHPALGIAVAVLTVATLTAGMVALLPPIWDPALWALALAGSLIIGLLTPRPVDLSPGRADVPDAAPLAGAPGTGAAPCAGVDGVRRPQRPGRTTQRDVLFHTGRATVAGAASQPAAPATTLVLPAVAL